MDVIEALLKVFGINKKKAEEIRDDVGRHIRICDALADVAKYLLKSYTGNELQWAMMMFGSLSYRMGCVEDNLPEAKPGQDWC